MKIEIPYTPTAKQTQFHATDANEVLYGGAAGGGKMLELSTPILTLAGWKTMGTVEVGDMVFGLDGAPHKVLRCSPIKEHNAWRFIFDDGSKIVCDGEHLWFTYTASEPKGVVRTADEIARTLYLGHIIPTCKPVELDGVARTHEGPGASYFGRSSWTRREMLNHLLDVCPPDETGKVVLWIREEKNAQSAAFLVRSLGMKCTVERRWRVHLSGIRRWHRLVFNVKKRYQFHHIVSVEKVESAKMRCIAIDSADHLYLAGHALIPTHNSKAIVMDALARCLAYPNTHAYCFRRTFPELEDTLVREARNSYPPQIATYNAGRHEMKLINGSEIHFRHCASIADKDNYRGIEIQWLYIDELTTFEQEIYDFLKTRLRAKKALGIVPTIRCASNPGGIGHGWVKTMFVDRGEYGTKIDIGKYSETLKRKVPYTIQYIPALATDNPFIGEDYITELERKPEALRKALLEGNWDAFEGQVFTEWRDDPDHYDDRKWTHVIKPFEIPAHWPRFMGFDHGYTKPFSCLWFAVGPDGCMYLYREWYGWDGTPDKGMKITPRQIAEGIAKREQEHEALDNIFIDRYADPAIFDKSRGESVAEQMEPGRNGPGVFFSEGDNARIAGKMQMHERLRFDDNGRPRLQVFSSCSNFIRTVPTLPYDERKPEDVDTKSEDHIYDSCRYVLMANPMPVRETKPRAPKPYDPFDRD